MIVRNVSKYAYERKFITFRFVEGDAWYYGAWDDYEKAVDQAIEIGGHVIPIEEVQEAK